MIREFFRNLALAIAIALIWFGIYAKELIDLIKALSLAVGIVILFSIFYPAIRGIRKGDRVDIILGNTPYIRSGIALSSARLNDYIRIRLDDGREAEGRVERYAGILNYAQVRVTFIEKIDEKEGVKKND